MADANRRDVKVICAEDCGNAPRKKLLLDFNVAFAKNDAEFILEHLADDITWHIIGDQTIRGKAQVAESLQGMMDSKATEIRIDNMITHGRIASANGVLVFGDQSFAFCDVYVFNSTAKHARIKEMTSYVIPIS